MQLEEEVSGTSCRRKLPGNYTPGRGEVARRRTETFLSYARKRMLEFRSNINQGTDVPAAEAGTDEVIGGTEETSTTSGGRSQPAKREYSWRLKLALEAARLAPGKR
jgi:hypothetical protein